MTLAQKIEQLLKDELKSENVKTVIEMAEFLKFKESQKRWDEIHESAPEYITDEERKHFEEIKAKGEYVSQEQLLKELGIDKDEVSN
jgi:hypothetical protein